MFNRVEFIGHSAWRFCLWVLFSGFLASGLALPVLTAAPQDTAPLSKAEKRRQKAIQKEMERLLQAVARAGSSLHYYRRGKSGFQEARYRR